MTTNMNDLADFYNKMGPLYDEWMQLGESKLEDELKLVLQTFPNPCRILDVGCGTGRISIPLQDMGYSVVGVDISEGMLAQARNKGLSQIFHTDFASFKYAQSSFDAIISLHAGFSYTQDTIMMNKMIQKCYDLLDKEGSILWDSPNCKFYGMKIKLKWPSDFGNIETICYGHNVEKLSELIVNSGFTIQDIWSSYTPLKKYEDKLPRLIINAKKVTVDE